MTFGPLPAVIGWAIYTAILILLTHILYFLIKNKVLHRKRIWIGVEYVWNVISLVAIVLAILQIENKFSDVRLSRVASDLKLGFVQLAGSANAITYYMQMPDMRAKIHDFYGVTIDDNDLKSIEYYKVQRDEAIAIPTSYLIYKMSDKLCASFFTAEWRPKVRSIDSLADEVPNYVSARMAVRDLCQKLDKIASLGSEWKELNSSSQDRNDVYQYAFLWSYILSFGLALKTVKSTNDLMIARQGSQGVDEHKPG